MEKPPFLKKVKHVHMVGIGGIGMFALACCLQDLKIKITGSDTKDLFMTDIFLKERKIKWKTGFSQKNLSPKPDLLITTAAHGGLNNLEVKTALKEKIPVLTHAQALGNFMEGKEGISVCGVGGKSSTASIIATLLDKAGRKPSYAIGVATISPLGYGGKYNPGKEFVAEADEYANCSLTERRPRFCFQKPKVMVVTNIEYDHPDVYQNLDHTLETFQAFFNILPKDGLLVACVDNPNVRRAIKGLKVNYQTYGFSPQADWRVEKTSVGQEQVLFDLSYEGGIIDQIKLKVPGKFNVLNATAAFAVGTFFGLDARVIKKGLAFFGGTKRRFEHIGEANGIELFDDYAHHPEEIRATLGAAKQWFPAKKIIVVFQPHTYSRTKALFKEFARCFSLANQVVITEIYASAREKDDLGVSGKLLAEETVKYHPKVIYKAGEKEVAEFIKQNAQAGDVIFTMGAGDIFLWHDSILKSLKGK